MALRFYLILHMQFGLPSSFLYPHLLLDGSTYAHRAPSRRN